jgi:hypothetical protein
VELFSERAVVGAVICDNAAVIKEIHHIRAHRVAYWLPASQASRWVRETPTFPAWGRQERFLESTTVLRAENPGVLLSHQRLVRWIETTPYEREMAIVIVQESLV